MLAGHRRHAEIEYPCHSPTEQRWFVVEATAIEGPGGARAVVAHHPITLRRLADMRQREELRLQALGTLAGGIAHDFNNLLSVILGRARMALEDLGPGHAVAQHLTPVRAAAERASALAAKVLAFSRGDSGPSEVHDLVPVVHDTMALIRAGLPSGVRLSTDIAADPLLARGDPTEVAQVVLNLCRNAVDALPEAHGHVHLRLAQVPAALATSGRHDLGSAELEVSDDGSGIPEHVRERIFEPLFSTKVRGQGTGLGLSIVHGIVTRLGGAIEVHSRPGLGSRFTVRIPLAAAEAASAAPLARAEPRHGERFGRAPPIGHVKRVLLVDDDEVVGLALEAFLTRAHYVIQRVQSGAEALRLLQDGSPFDLVLTDNTMPGMSGLELASALGRQHPELPVVLISGFVDGQLQKDALARGVRTVLRKERVYDELLPMLSALQGTAAA